MRLYCQRLSAGWCSLRMHHSTGWPAYRPLHSCLPPHILAKSPPRAPPFQLAAHTAAQPARRTWLVPSCAYLPLLAAHRHVARANHPQTVTDGHQCAASADRLLVRLGAELVSWPVRILSSQRQHKPGAIYHRSHNDVYERAAACPFALFLAQQALQSNYCVKVHDVATWPSPAQRPPGGTGALHDVRQPPLHRGVIRRATSRM